MKTQEPKSTRPPEVQALLDERDRLQKEGYDTLFKSTQKVSEAKAIVLGLAEKALGIPAVKLTCSFTWGCSGPFDVCVFEKGDTCKDHCLFCGGPEERK